MIDNVLYAFYVSIYVCMLVHPITGVLNAFSHGENSGLIVRKYVGVQNQEDHIDHVLLLKTERYLNR